LEEVVHGVAGAIADAGDGSEGVSTDAKVGDFAEELEAGPFLLEGVVGRIGGAEEFEGVGAELDGLAGAGGFDEFTGEGDAGSGGGLLQEVFGDGTGGDDDLEVGEAGAVVELDEGDALTVAARFDPTVGGGLGSG
jgi:hypothetical protein